ncbi:MAG: agmatinase [Thermodesulfobacteriota bacterium]|nr:agmatinase [Thermodesulfobacteriota bacterium]
MANMANFLGIQHDRAQFEKSPFVIMQIPYDHTTSYKSGARYGPKAIIDASHHLEEFDEELELEISEHINIYTHAPLEINELDPCKIILDIKSFAEIVFKNKKIPVLLGGEHTITLGNIFSAKTYFDPFTLLYCDAHSDLRDIYNGTQYNHACVSKRALDNGIHIVQVGIRSLSKDEHELIKKNRISVYYANKLKNEKDWIENITPELKEKVYISIDLDCLDPSIMPSVGTPEPGGMSWEYLTAMLRYICENREIIGFDVVELSPINGIVAPNFLAAKLVYKLIGYISKGMGFL